MESYLAEKLFLIVILVTIVIFAIYDIYYEND
jgi:cell division protein FtsL